MPDPARPRIEGYAIISREGMIAETDGAYPAVLKIPADQKFFHEALARAAGIVNGRHSAEDTPEAPTRRRIVLTRRITGIDRDPARTKIVLWNPAGAAFEAAWQALGGGAGMAAVIGGTDVFDLFLDVGYDTFWLTCAEASVPNGRPVFTLQSGETAQDVLRRHGYGLVETTMLDAPTRTRLERWQRA
jgi:dihydrofolate reductase